MLAMTSWPNGEAMQDGMNESDWKVFRKLREVALDRFCERVLGKLQRVASDRSQTNHARYLAIWELMREEDKDLQMAFDASRRSVALMQLAFIQRHVLLTDEELGQFSPGTLS